MVQAAPTLGRPGECRLLGKPAPND
jgi:hypothetical protein